MQDNSFLGMRCMCDEDICMHTIACSLDVRSALLVTGATASVCFFWLPVNKEFWIALIAN